VLAVPSLAINMLSTDPQQYSGLFQYNAEIVPVLIFAAIEALVVVRWATRLALAEIARRQDLRQPQEHDAEIRGGAVSRRPWMRVVPTALLALLAIGTIGSSLRTDYYFHGVLPFSVSFQWPQTSAHTELAQHFIAMIPADASVSAQTKLVPHLSHRESIYMFPYADKSAQYVFLDVTGDIYPYFQSSQYTQEVGSVLASGKYGVVAAQDGYLLLKRGLPAPSMVSSANILNGTVAQHADTYSLADVGSSSFELPSSFCSYIYASPQNIQNPVNVEFTRKGQGTMSLIGYDVGASSPFSRTNGYGTLTTYWRVSQPMRTPVQEEILLTGSNGHEYTVSTDVPDLSWCSPATWKANAIVRITSRTFNVQASGVPNGLAKMSMVLLPQAQSSSKIGDGQLRLSLRILNASGNISASQKTNVLQLMSLDIVN
jgi:hypothetical protein